MIGNRVKRWFWLQLAVYHAAKRSVDKELFCLKKAAELGSSIAQNELGVHFLTGDVVKMDKEKAYHYFLQSAQQEDMYGEANLAALYEQGVGVERDLDLAKNWYEKAARQGYKESIKALTDLE